MNLRERLAQRSIRGTEIGSSALMARLETELTPKRFSIINPGLGFAAAAVATLIVVGGVLVALRPDEEPVPPAEPSTTTTIEATTTTTEVRTETTAPAETTLSTEAPQPITELPADPVALRQFVWNFDPEADNVDLLRQALVRYDTSPYAVIRLIEEGDEEVRAAVLDYLRQPGAWKVQTLALMNQYGSPAGSRDDPVAWPASVKREIFSALQEAAQVTFGNEAELLVALQLAVAEQEMQFCDQEFGGCDWGYAWYAVADTVVSVEGQQDGAIYDGQFGIASDTGGGGFIDFTALLTETGWVLLEGYRTESPFVSVSTSPIVTVLPSVELWGFADPNATVTVGGETTPVGPDGYWSKFVVTEPGDQAVAVEATWPDGSTSTTSVPIRNAPNAEAHFAIVVGLETSSGQPRLLVEYAEMLSGDEAVQAAIEDGELPADQADEGLPNDYYIRNLDPRLRSLAIDQGAVIHVFDMTRGADFDYDLVTIDEYVEAARTGESTYYDNVVGSLVWLLVDDGVVISIDPQYTP